MIKIFIIAIAVSLTVFGCRPAKKVQKIQEAISKIDTVSVVVVEDKKNTADSLRKVREVYNNVFKNKIDYKTFSAKVRVEYDGKEGGDEATAFIRLEKDKMMWLSLRGALGIEGFRLLVTRDSVKVMNLLKKQVQYRSISYLQEITELPFDFSTLQDLIVGNPVFVDSNIVSYRVNGNNELLILMVGSLFKNLVTLDNGNYRIIHSKLDDVDLVRNRTCDISFNDYETTSGFAFSTKRRISVAEKSKLDINLDFKQYEFNKPVTFPFTVPKNYKVAK
jgi:hypothetical protein